MGPRKRKWHAFKNLIAGIRTKISLGGFTAVFFVQCLAESGN
jgi:hypothetical protein